MSKVLSLSAVLMAALVFFGFSGSKNRTLKQSVTLQMPATGGSNGAAVAYNPSKKLYYGIMAGNAAFPLLIFDKKGETVGQKYTAGFDSRGLWYNEKTKCLEGNAYSDYGYYSIKLNDKGILTGEPEVLVSGMNQPDDNNMGAYDSKDDEIIFRSQDVIYFYSKVTGKSNKSMGLLDLPVSWSNINEYSVVYTGMKKREIGIIDFVEKRIYLFNIKDGKFNSALDLPKEAPVEEMFNFSCCNGIFWLFSKSDRKWYGYK